MHVLRGFLGVAVILGLAWVLSKDRRAIRYRVVVIGLLLQAILGLFVFKTSAGRETFRALADIVRRVLEFSYAGSAFVFGKLGARSDGDAFSLAFQALPILIYFSALIALLYHAGIMQVAVYAFSRAIGALLRVSGAESMVVTANIFVGMTEAPLVVRPYLARMTRSELMALMTGGFATVAGTVLGIYMLFVGEEYAPCLLAASLMSAPAAIVIAKIILPETAAPVTGRSFRLAIERPARNALDAIATGVRDGLHLALNIAAMLIAFYALIALANWPLEALLGTTVQELLGWVLSPVAWSLGADWADATEVGSLLGTKIVINEFVGYRSLQEMIASGAIGDRSIKIATFALCGFANFGSIGITLGGLGQLIPERRGELAELALLAMVAGALASFLTATVAGVFL